VGTIEASQIRKAQRRRQYVLIKVRDPVTKRVANKKWELMGSLKLFNLGTSDLPILLVAYGNGVYGT
jgi:hypothetical protein